MVATFTDNTFGAPPSGDAYQETGDGWDNATEDDHSPWWWWWNSQGFQGDYRYTDAADATATWTLSQLQAGKVYELFATWLPGYDRDPTAQYVISGARAMGRPAAGEALTVTVDQRYVPGETAISGSHWRSLGFYCARATRSR